MVVQTTLGEMSCSCMNICCEIGKLKKTKKKEEKKRKRDFHFDVSRMDDEYPSSTDGVRMLIYALHPLRPNIMNLNFTCASAEFELKA